jgi:hypothetical protein
MDAPTNPVDRVRDRLDGGRLWLKGSEGDWQRTDTPVCLLGACASVASDQADAVPHEIREVIGEQFPERFTFKGVDEFNDFPETTWPDVQLVLEKASALFDERVA